MAPGAPLSVRSCFITTGRPIRTIFAENYERYGQRRMYAALHRGGEQVGRDRVARLMRAAGTQGAKWRGKPWCTTIADPAAQKRLDLVQQESRRRTAYGSAISRICARGRARVLAFVIDLPAATALGHDG